MGAVSEDGNPFGTFYEMLRKQLAKMKRELAVGDACVVMARIDAIDSMVEVIQGDDWANEKREAEFVEELRTSSQHVQSIMRCLEDGESVQAGDEVYDTLEQDWRAVPGDLVGTVFCASSQHPVRRKVVACVEG